ncbi:MAG: DUF1475 family protein [Vampirovibrionales bacterium]|nr:DUF1475 family protein [Vampirovibrionales bacterium]
MKLRLIILFSIIFLAMVSVVTWASFTQSLLAIPEPVAKNPWFIATLFDAYAGFLTIYAWVAYREPKLSVKILWLMLFMGLGNIAISAYVLLAIAKLPKGEPITAILLPKKAAQAA